VSRVLVTGASGFLGAHVLAPLTQAGHEVHALTHGAVPTQAGDLGRQGGDVVWHRADLTGPLGAEAVIADIAADGLVHMAWYVVHGDYRRAPENVLWVEATLRLLRGFAAAGGRRAVLAGTCAEYEWSSLEPYREIATPLAPPTPLAPATLYGTAKHATQLVSTAFAAEVGLELAWGRIFIPYGPGEAGGRLLASVTRALLAGAPAPVTDGAQVRDFMYVQDVARAFAAILDSPAQGAINVASGEGRSVRELIELAASETGRPELVQWGAVPQREGEPARLVADVTRLQSEIGFAASVGLQEGVARTVEWLRREA
jgi:nucleoside-diphosphate-sugar epimerase